MKVGQAIWCWTYTLFQVNLTYTFILWGNLTCYELMREEANMQNC